MQFQDVLFAVIELSLWGIRENVMVKIILVELFKKLTCLTCVVLHAEPLPPEEKCIIPECTNRRYTEGSVRHQYCSKYHAEEGRRRGIYRKLGFTVGYWLVVLFPQLFSTLLPSVCHSLLNCACDSLPVASAQDLKDQCDLPNCTRPKAVESNGYKYNYCCRDHALKDGEGGIYSGNIYTLHNYIIITYY